MGIQTSARLAQKRACPQLKGLVSVPHMCVTPHVYVGRSTFRQPAGKAVLDTTHTPRRQSPLGADVALMPLKYLLFLILTEAQHLP